MRLNKEVKKLLKFDVQKIHTGENRLQRRNRIRIRVRNKSIATCHPSMEKELKNSIFIKLERGIEKNMSNSYKLLEKELMTGKGLGFIRNLLNKNKKDV